MRLAWFTPWPPQRSGVAGRSAEVVPALAGRGHALDVFVDEQAVPISRADDGAPPSGAVRVQSAHEFPWRVARGQYDLAVYQLGNSSLHDFIWPYLLRWPGLVVLHDSRLHHARGHARLSRHMIDRYRRELAATHPDLPVDAAELGVRGFEGAYYYQWPMIADIVAGSRLTLCHARGAARELAEQWPEAATGYLPLGEGRDGRLPDDQRASVRRSLGLEPGTVLLGIFGALTAEKRVVPIIGALAAIQAHVPHVRLLLCGTPADEPELRQTLTAVGLDSRVIWSPSPDDARFDDLIAAVDVSLHLRWPTALETSGPWLRALAAGRATVVTDLPHLSHVPALDPRDWRDPPGRQAAVAVAIDILDEDHSLRLALKRLATDEALRDQLGRAGRAYWEREHTLPRMIEGYEAAMARAAAAAPPPVAAARQAGADPWASVRRLLSDFPEGTCTFD